MKRFRGRLKQLSIRKKLVLYSYLIISPILLFISAFLFVVNYKSTIQKENSNYQQGVQNLSDGISEIQKNMIEFGTYICINSDIENILSSNKPEVLNLDSRIWLNRAPMKIIQDMMALDGHIKTIALYPENGVTPYLRCMDASCYLSDFNLVKNTDTYKLAKENKGKFIWRMVDKKDRTTYQTNRSIKIVMYREIYDLSKKKPLGYLVIGAKANKFIELCQNTISKPGEEIVLVSEDGTTLIQCGEIENEQVSKIIKRCLKEPDSKGDDISQILFDKYIVLRCKNFETGMYLFKIIPKDCLRTQIINIVYTPAILLIALMFALYPILVFVSIIVSKPLKKVCVAMEKFKLGDFNQKVDVNTYDEVGQVAACFNQMVEDIRILINKNYVMALKEKESELNALQAQINPHFLYNTLDSLYWKALGADNEEIAEDILSLSELFRLVLAQGKEMVTVEEEKRLIEEYLHVQKMRFGKKLNFKIAMDDDILGSYIPKLILQPFVENAIVHGLEKAGETCLLSVFGTRSGNMIEFLIKDTGVGMTSKQIEEILNMDEMVNSSGQRIGRYAIKNVMERMKLKYHDQFDFKIESQVGIGTTIKIKVPYSESIK